MQSIGQLVITGIEFLAVWALFDRFHHLLGWTLPEIGFLYGYISIVFAVTDACARGFDKVPSLIRTGELDRILLRPVSPLIQVAGQEFTIRRVGRLLQSLAIFIWAIGSLNLHWTLLKYILLLFSATCGAILFFGIFILQATLCFWTVESVEIGNIITYGGVETLQMPLSIYPKAFQRFFTYIVPLGCTSYYPLLFIMNKTDSLGMPVWFQLFSPLLGVIFFLLAWWAWKIGINHYTSAGG